ncbi:hypothetical protein B0T26DRAFT_804391 [Lasiosphaeria miniovina]|uniref:Protein kinase domain-containing protein n=1 Tax=Lasiosphaeria miniovina TaxID=1954250 RepID=A0AA40AD34_9PEZI|nr:uncharacterized protein B0T26DRAFT_804391 [Lasiosphaeria miniovina]KAK0713667.1 hypothetical protein B0T26DRAFT_804391 [Lasiosphaeria miniovina]
MTSLGTGMPAAASTNQPIGGNLFTLVARNTKALQILNLPANKQHMEDRKAPDDGKEIHSFPVDGRRDATRKDSCCHLVGALTMTSSSRSSSRWTIRITPITIASERVFGWEKGGVLGDLKLISRMYDGDLSQLVPRRDLHDQVLGDKCAKPVVYSYDWMERLVEHLLAGLTYLQDQKVVHYDLKIPNIFFMFSPLPDHPRIPNYWPGDGKPTRERGTENTDLYILAIFLARVEGLDGDSNKDGDSDKASDGSSWFTCLKWLANYGYDGKSKDATPVLPRGFKNILVKDNTKRFAARKCLDGFTAKDYIMTQPGKGRATA